MRKAELLIGKNVGTVSSSEINRSDALF